MGEVRHDLLRDRVRYNRRRIRQSPSWLPPDRSRMLISFDLTSVGTRQLRILVDCVVDLASGFPAVLRSLIDKGVVVPAIARVRGNVGVRIVPLLQVGGRAQDSQDIWVHLRLR